MALQLIYTSSAQLLDSSLSGYGTVARSEVMPREMRRKLAELSRYRSVPGCRTDSVQCSYTTLTHGNAEYHVLSVSQPAGADYSGRMCHISHHLVLLPEEVSALLRNKYRPTPAGIILALGKSGFWCKKWNGKPAFINGEPHLHSQDIPTADNQPTWKKLTGHKSNARAFSTAPFERDCLMTVAPETSTADILKLWHESDWLTPCCGWGRTFTSHADDADNFRLFQRWACCDASPLIRKAMRTGHPVLPIGQDLEIGELSDDTQSASCVLHPEDAGQFRAQLAARQAARHIPPYQYSEEPDEEVYDLSDIRRRKRRKTAGAIVAAALLLGGGIITGSICYFQKNPVKISDHAAIRSLRELINKPYQANYAAQELDKAEALARTSKSANSAQNRAVIQIINLIQQASEAERHADNLRRLCHLAKKWKLDKVNLCLLYMREATHNRPPSEWMQSFSREELNAWEKLISDEPELRDGLNDPGLLTYFDRVMGKKSSPSLKESVSPSGAEKWFPVTANDELPLEMRQLLQTSPTSLTQGEVVVFRMPWRGESAAPEKILLHPESSVCNIVRSAANGYYHLRFSDPTGLSARSHADIDICIKQHRLISISSSGVPVAVVLPLSHSGGVILMPKLAIPLSGIHAPQLPPAEDVNLDISPDSIRVLPPSASHMAVRLEPMAGTEFVRLPKKQNNAAQRFSFNLPHLTPKGNVIPPPEISAANPETIQWNGIEETESREYFSTFTCSLTPISDINAALRDAFNKIANSGCAGEVSNADPMFSLAMVYTTLQIMDKEGVTEEEWDSATSRYCTLFNNKSFCELMKRVAKNSESVILSHEAASSRSAAGKTERRRVLKLLKDADNRHQLTADILQYISERLRAAYLELRSQLAEDTELRLVLRRLSCEDGRLNWHFTLQSSDETSAKSAEP